MQCTLWLVAIVSISLNIYLIALAPSPVEINTAQVEENLDKGTDEEHIKILETLNNAKEEPILIPVDKTTPLANKETNQEYTLHKGEILNKALFKIGFQEGDANKISESVNKVFKLSNLKSGNKIKVDEGITSKGIFKKLTIFAENNKIEVLTNADKETFHAKNIVLPLKSNVKFVSGKVNGSLFSSAKKTGADSNVIIEFINLFSYSVDFQREVKLGDGFKILYEYQTTNSGKVIKLPKIVYAHITVNGEIKSIYRHILSNGRIDYFDDSGNSVKNALMKTPVNGARLSSTFGMRKHPVFGYSKMHQGLDYSAPKGTAIVAAGDGTVQFAKSQANGYGKHIQIKHNGTYSTLYAHMSRFADGINAGKKVKQGQVIGYVGATGTATGPHLHFEVIEKGKKVNPAKITFPKTPPLKGNELKKFHYELNKMEKMIAEFETGKRHKIALLDNYSTDGDS